MKVHRGWLVAAVVLAGLAFAARGEAGFALTHRFDALSLPAVRVPGRAVVASCAVICLAAALVRRRWLAVLAGVAAVAGFITWAASGSPVDFLVSSQLSGTVAYATPLVLGGLGGLLCERSGIVNIAIEGQFLAASFAACVVASMTASVVVGLAAGVAAGVAVAALLAVFTINMLVGQVVLGIVLNLLASGLTGFWFAQFVAADPRRFNSAPVLERGWLAVAAGLAVVLVWTLVQRTKWGLRVRAVGENPLAAASAGVAVRRVRWQAVLLGGALAGLGGCYFTLATTGQFTRNVTSGYGFVALAALIMGRWQPVRTALVGLGFGFVMQLAAQLQSMGTVLDSQLLLILPYAVTVLAVAGIVGHVRAPAASGQEYRV